MFPLRETLDNILLVIWGQSTHNPFLKNKGSFLKITLLLPDRDLITYQVFLVETFIKNWHIIYHYLKIYYNKNYNIFYKIKLLEIFMLLK